MIRCTCTCIYNKLHVISIPVIHMHIMYIINNNKCMYMYNNNYTCTLTHACTHVHILSKYTLACTTIGNKLMYMYMSTS